MPILSLGIIISLFELKEGTKRDAFPITSVTIIGITLSIPIIHTQWLWRFLIMEFIPIAFIIGYAGSKYQSNSLYKIIFFSILILLISQSILYSRTLQPSISEKHYREIEIIREFIPVHSLIISNSYQHIRYWIQYIARCDITNNLSQEMMDNNKKFIYLLDNKYPSTLPLSINKTKFVEETR